MTSLSTVGFGVFSAQAVPTIEYSAGHADIGVVYEGGELELHYHFDSPSLLAPIQIEDEFSPDEVYVRVADSQRIGRYVGDQWDFLGNATGEDTWVLPDDNLPGVPFLGMAAEEVGNASDWIGDITFEFNSVTVPAGAHFSIWETNFFGNINPLVVTSDGLPDSLSVVVGGHNHYDWGFTAEGVYQIEITASGTHASDGFVSDTETFWFAVGDSTVIPAPTSAALVGIGVICLRRRRGVRA